MRNFIPPLPTHHGVQLRGQGQEVTVLAPSRCQEGYTTKQRQLTLSPPIMPSSREQRTEHYRGYLGQLGDCLF